MRRSRIQVTGASGSGTTTLGRALADLWSVPHADADDHLFVPPVVDRHPVRPPKTHLTVGASPPTIAECRSR
jgi:type II secretory pathway predicted ATPase ExeA